MHVDLVDEQGVAAAGVGRRVVCRVVRDPVAGEFVVGGVHEGLALLLGLADEDHVGREGVVAGLGEAADPLLGEPRRDADTTPAGGAAPYSAQSEPWSATPERNSCGPLTKRPLTVPLERHGSRKIQRE